MNLKALLFVVFFAFPVGTFTSSDALAMGGMGMGMGGGANAGGIYSGGVGNGDAGGSVTGAVSGMGKHMEMGPHLTMTAMRAATPDDTACAQQIYANHARPTREIFRLQSG